MCVLVVTYKLPLRKKVDPRIVYFCTLCSDRSLEENFKPLRRRCRVAGCARYYFANARISLSLYRGADISHPGSSTQDITILIDRRHQNQFPFELCTSGSTKRFQIAAPVTSLQYVTIHDESVSPSKTRGKKVFLRPGRVAKRRGTITSVYWTLRHFTAR